jgi:hypothetical protein
MLVRQMQQTSIQLLRFKIISKGGEGSGNFRAFNTNELKTIRESGVN